jgi:predicted KAP-like P-loop ATPase
MPVIHIINALGKTTMSSLGLTDKPVVGIEHERLGMKDYVDAMSEFVRTCQTPMTIAIQGDWGTGKTSMMNMVLENLSKGTMKIETRLFNTWQYAQFQEQDEIAI